MATNKNQHFVPRVHLCPFTQNSEGLSINLYNLDRKLFIPKAPVKNQCSKDYFYGTDEQLDRAIQLVESGYGKALRDLISNNCILTETSNTILRTFWILQHLRTEAAAMRAVEMSEMTRTLADIPPEEFSLSIKEAVQYACRTFVDAMHELDDLKFCIVKNKSKIPFITSDNPAILTNRWRLDEDRTHVRSFGMGSAGMIALLPLTPKLLIIGYDGDVYNVPNEKGIAEIRNPRDAIAFNRHQFLQCVANVYVNDPSYKESIIEQYAAVESIRPKLRHKINYAQFDSVVGNHKRYIVVPPDERDKRKEAIMHSQVIHPHPGIWPSQIQIRSKGYVYTNDTEVGYVRLSRTMTSDKPFRRERI